MLMLLVLFCYRYDHYAVMCELLPVAVPSLALCLVTLCQSEYDVFCCWLMVNFICDCQC